MVLKFDIWGFSIQQWVQTKDAEGKANIQEESDLGLHRLPTGPTSLSQKLGLLQFIMSQCALDVSIISG